jgi:hypothetical protein
VGGNVGINHYQCAKAVFETSRAVKPKGKIVLLGNLTDHDPIGGENYKKMLRLLTSLGHKGFLQTISADDWSFIPEQWQVQMWSRGFEKLGSCKNLYTCSPQLKNCPPGLIPEVNIASEFEKPTNESDINYTQRIVQLTIERLIKNQDRSEIAVLPDGPDAIPILNKN